MSLVKQAVNVNSVESTYINTRLDEFQSEANYSTEDEITAETLINFLENYEVGNRVLIENLRLFNEWYSS